MDRIRKPSHPGEILDEHYIKPLQLNLRELADKLKISRNTLYEIRMGKASITAPLALRLGQVFDTSPELWLNLQQKYDLWIARRPIKRARPHRKSRFVRKF